MLGNRPVPARVYFEDVALSAIQPRKDDDLLSYPEVETITGFSRTTIWRLLKSGEIQTARCGRSVRVSRQSLEAYMRRDAEGHAPW